MKLNEIEGLGSFWAAPSRFGKHPIHTDKMKGVKLDEVMEDLVKRFVWEVKSHAHVNAQVQGVVADETWIYNEVKKKITELARKMENEAYNQIY